MKRVCKLVTLKNMTTCDVASGFNSQWKSAISLRRFCSRSALRKQTWLCSHSIAKFASLNSI